MTNAKRVGTIKTKLEISAFHLTLHGHENWKSISACKPNNIKLNGTEVMAFFLENSLTAALKKVFSCIFKALGTVPQVSLAVPLLRFVEMVVVFSTISVRQIP